MAKDKFKKRQDRRRLIRGEMTKRGISGREIAARVGMSQSAVSRYCATSPRIVAALIEAGVPARTVQNPPQPPKGRRGHLPYRKGGREGGGGAVGVREVDNPPSPRPSPARGEGVLKTAGGDAGATKTK